MIEQILQADRLLNVDQVERARELYARVVSLDPGNAIAVVGLARCALAEGDDHEAHALASRALRIDPENDMARRMEARLAEVLAARGERVVRPAGDPSGLRPIVTGSVHGSLSAADSQRPVTQPGEGRPIAPSGDTTRGDRPTRGPQATQARRSLLDRLRGRG